MAGIDDHHPTGRRLDQRDRYRSEPRVNDFPAEHEEYGKKNPCRGPRPDGCNPYPSLHDTAQPPPHSYAAGEGFMRNKGYARNATYTRKPPPFSASSTRPANPCKNRSKLRAPCCVRITTANTPPGTRAANASSNKAWTFFFPVRSGGFDTTAWNAMPRSGARPSPCTTCARLRPWRSALARARSAARSLTSTIKTSASGRSTAIARPNGP